MRDGPPNLHFHVARPCIYPCGAICRQGAMGCLTASTSLNACRLSNRGKMDHVRGLAGLHTLAATVDS